jgi:hypothetical protein
MSGQLGSSAGAVIGFGNFSVGFNGASAPLAPLAIQASVNTTWTWAACVNTAGNAGIYTVALKGGFGLGGVAKRTQPPFIIKNTNRPKPRIIRVSLENYR